MMNMLNVVSVLAMVLIILGIISIIRGHHQNGKSSRHSKFLTGMGIVILSVSIGVGFHGYQTQFLSIFDHWNVHIHASTKKPSPSSTKDDPKQSTSKTSKGGNKGQPDPADERKQQNKQRQAMVNAIDNNQPTYQDKEMATQEAQDIVNTSSTSENALYQQLISSPNDLSPDSAKYALKSIKVDWDQQAVKAGQAYQDGEHLSGMDLYEQLVSSEADQFTPNQAQYAIKHV